MEAVIEKTEDTLFVSPVGRLDTVSSAELTEQIKEEDLFIARTDRYRDKTVAGIDFNRLLRFMTDLHDAKDLSGYLAP